MKNQNQIHVGKLVHFIISKNQINEEKLCYDLNITKMDLEKLYKKPSIQFSRLAKLSKFINYNIVLDIGELLQVQLKKPV